MTTDFVLWQWSLLTQLGSAAMIAGFFLVFGRSFRTAELRPWQFGWLGNLVALLVTAIDTFWISATPGLTLGAICVSYIIAKAFFLAGLLEGLALAIAPDRPLWTSRTRFLVIAAIGTACALLVRSYEALGLMTQAIFAIGCVAGAVIAGRHLDHPVRWLTLGFALRAVLSLAEMIGYASNTTPPVLTLPVGAEVLDSLLSASSFFDTSTEWLLALGCVLAVTSRAQRELESRNVELREAQAALRAMVDVDPLTGLANRRALPTILREVQPFGASIVFIDLHGFKDINDERGHQAGDDALKWFATALQESFRPHDAIVRYAGDEFVVVARALERGAMIARLEELRARLTIPGTPGPRISFDAGHAELEPGGSPEDAIRLADLAMYDAKERAKELTGRARRQAHAST